MNRKRLQRLALAGLSTAALAVLTGFAWLFWRDYRSPTLEEVLRWLPADTEAVAFVGKPITLPGSPEEPFELLTHIPLFPVVLGIISQDRRVTDLLKLAKCTADRTCVGMRDFGMDPGGFRTFEGASIFVFGPGNITSADSLFKGLSALSNNGWVFSSAVVHQAALCVARPRGTVVVAATSEGYLQEVLSRMKEHIGKSSMAPFVREGLLRSGGSGTWAYRVFDRGISAARDPFSPRRPDPRRSEALDPGARNIFLSSPPGNQPGLDVEYSSGSPDAIQRIARGWDVLGSEGGPIPTVGDSQSGKIQLHFSKHPTARDLNDSLLWYFGMGWPEA